jgi:hypothetical protein
MGNGQSTSQLNVNNIGGVPKSTSFHSLNTTTTSRQHQQQQQQQRSNLNSFNQRKLSLNNIRPINDHRVSSDFSHNSAHFKNKNALLNNTLSFNNTNRSFSFRKKSSSTSSLINRTTTQRNFNNNRSLFRGSFLILPFISIFLN